MDKEKDFLVCVDSDGSVIDTMNIKHKLYFGPIAIHIWELETIENAFLEEWNKVNLYSKHRGINRFKGLVKTFSSLAKKGYDIPSMSLVEEWVNSTDQLSEYSLKKAIEKNNDLQLEKTLQWNYKVNQSIQNISFKPFENVESGLKEIKGNADIAIVSTANRGEIRNEWESSDLLPYSQALFGQEDGTKEICINKLINFGYDYDKVLMIGDAPGDLVAAHTNQVLFYPIIPGKEEDSWKRLVDQSFKRFINGSYDENYENQLINEFWGALN